MVLRKGPETWRYASVMPKALCKSTRASSSSLRLIAESCNEETQCRIPHLRGVILSAHLLGAECELDLFWKQKPPLQ